MDKREYSRRLETSTDHLAWQSELKYHLDVARGKTLVSTEVLNGLTLGKVILMPSPLQRWLEAGLSVQCWNIFCSL